MRMGMHTDLRWVCAALLESSRQGGHHKYRHSYTPCAGDTVGHGRCRAIAVRDVAVVRDDCDGGDHREHHRTHFGALLV